MTADAKPADNSAAPRFFALVPCAGTGSRAGGDGPKQYARLAGQALVGHTLAALKAVPCMTATLVVLSPGDKQFERQVPEHTGPQAWLAWVGGVSRARTVQNGLTELQRRGALAQDWVLVHDAARCLLRADWVLRLIDACRDDAVGGLLALPLVDTLKQADGGRVLATVDRSGKWAAQTPQMFRLGLLQAALQAAGAQVTDEASAVEASGLRPLLVPGEAENFKVTYPGDFALAERLLRTAPRPGGPMRHEDSPAKPAKPATEDQR